MGTPIENMDFSIFHPLDHPIWDSVCPTFYGGRRNHFSLWRDYKAPQPIQYVKCRLGHHDWTEYWQGRGFGHDGPPAGEMCRSCLVTRKAAQTR